MSLFSKQALSSENKYKKWKDIDIQACISPCGRIADVRYAIQHNEISEALEAFFEASVIRSIISFLTTLLLASLLLTPLHHMQLCTRPK